MSDVRCETDPGPPYLFVDLYPLDLGAKPPWQAVVEAPHFVGAIIKATEGTSYPYTSWFVDNWRQLRSVGRERYAQTWFRGAYHFLSFASDGEAQADYYLRTVGQGGGWCKGDIVPIVDVELGGKTHRNGRASAQQIIDCTSSWAERVRSETGRRVMLYGRGAMRDLGIHSRMQCDVVWNPSYTRRMRLNGIVTINGKPGPWKLDDIALWQYGGDGVGDARAHGLPLEIAGFGAVDVSVYVDAARTPCLESLRARLV